MKIIFMGTPEFAVPALEKLIESEHEVVAVYTRQPKEAGRGYKLTKTPVHELAEKNMIQVLTPESLKNEDVQEALKSFNADIIVVVAYGLILPKEVLQMFKYGCINIHPSLLPRWRGADPIRNTILAGDKQTGVTIIQVGEGIDNGDILRQVTMPLAYDTKYETLHDILAVMGTELLLKVLCEIDKKMSKTTPQDDNKATYTKKLESIDGKIDWRKSSEEIYRQIIALSSNPGVYFEYKGEKIKVFSAELKKEETECGPEKCVPGTVFNDDLCIFCGNEIICLKMLQRPGRKVMDVHSFLRGFPINKGEILE
jgi:methionyl-tRNA formyltransferase